MKRQKWIEGSFVKVELNDKSFFIIRLFSLYKIAIYDKHFSASDDITTEVLKELVNSKVLRYYSLSDRPIKMQEFPVIGHLHLSKLEIDAYPPCFMQNLARLNECTIYYYDESFRKATAEECIGLSHASIGQSYNLLHDLENHVANLPVWDWINHKVKLP